MIDAERPMANGPFRTPDAVRDPSAPPRPVVLQPDESIGPEHHESHSRRHVAEGVAQLLGARCVGEEGLDATPVYLVASRPLLPHEAVRYRIASPRDLLGAVVPHAFAGTKVITHPLVGPSRPAPEGWNEALAAELAPVTLHGWSAFDRDGARLAATRLLEHGPVRLKPADACGGHDQKVATDLAGFERALAQLDDGRLREAGVVVEEHLADVITCSVGVVEVGDWRAAYVGTQRETVDHHGRTVYGGSELDVVRGGFDEILAIEQEGLRVAAIRHAMHYDAAVHRAWPAFYGSRRNYDVIVGTSAAGARRVGVLEQSWRIGGASPAEIAALLAFKAEPSLVRVRAATHEVYGRPPLPDDAIVHFIDADGAIGGLVKFVTWRPHGRAA